AGAREVMLDLPLHRSRLAPDRLGQFAVRTRRTVDEHGERRLQRVREVACVKPRFLRLLLIVRKQRIKLLNHWLHLKRQRRDHTAVLSAAHSRNRAPDVTQWPEAVERLERRKRDQSQSKQPEARDKR